MKYICFLAAFVALAVQATEESDEDAKLAVQRLQDAVRKSIEANPDALIAPSLGTQDDALMLRLGGPKRQYGGPRMPIDYPLESQFAVELIRQQIAPKTPGVNWNDTFRQAEEIIRLELVDIQKLRDKPEELRPALDKKQREFVGVFEKALKGITKGGKVSVVVPKAAARYKVTVKVAHNKDGKDGVAFYLPVLQYEILKSSGGLDDDRNWNEVAGGTVQLGGEFHFLGRWGPSQTRITGVIPISEDQTVTVSPVD